VVSSRARVVLGIREAAHVLGRLPPAGSAACSIALTWASAKLLDAAVYDPQRLIEADRLVIDYLNWLAPVSHGRTSREETQ
jgi:hypothetical protein